MANNFLTKLFGNYSKKELKRIQPLVDQVLGLEEKYRGLSDDGLKGETPRLRKRLEDGEDLDDILPEAFAAAGRPWTGCWASGFSRCRSRAA